MTPDEFHSLRQTIDTPSGRISFVAQGEGPTALFVHGVPLNGYHWRHALEGLGDLRRCIAPDLMGLGYSEIAPDQPIDFDAQARMLLEFLDASSIDEVDLVGNDSGGAIAQIVATNAPDRIRSLTLTNCDTIGNWPPPAFMPILNLAKEGKLGRTFAAFRADPALAQSPAGLGVAFEFPQRLNDELLGVYLGPVTATAERQSRINDYVAAIEQGPTAGLLHGLEAFQKPTLIVWADGDVFFPTQWSDWLARIIPGTRKVAVLNGARLFFPEERPDILCALLREHWTMSRPEGSNRPAAA
jgi:pimeloyl-ACP methyl ester carboxylesterase